MNTGGQAEIPSSVNYAASNINLTTYTRASAILYLAGVLALNVDLSNRCATLVHCEDG
jgi:hypothetical protein